MFLIVVLYLCFHALFFLIVCISSHLQNLNTRQAIAMFGIRWACNCCDVLKVPSSSALVQPTPYCSRRGSSAIPLHSNLFHEINHYTKKNLFHERTDIKQNLDQICCRCYHTALVLTPPAAESVSVWTSGWLAFYGCSACKLSAQAYVVGMRSELYSSYAKDALREVGVVDVIWSYARSVHMEGPVHAPMIISKSYLQTPQAES